MRKSLSILFVIVTLSALNAQEFSFGFKAGLNFSTANGELELDGQGNEVEEISYSTGFNAGILIDYAFTDIFGVRTELLYSQKGRVINYDGDSYFIFNATQNPVAISGNRSLTADIINSYVQIPLIGYAKLGKIEFMGGAYASALIGSNANGRVEFRPKNRQSTNFDVLQLTVDYNHFRDKAGEGSGPLNTIFVNGQSIDINSATGAYHEYAEVNENLYNVLDVGLIGGISLYLNRGFFINGRLEYGLVDITDNDVDASLFKLSSGKLNFRNDNDQNFVFHTSVAFRF